MQTHVLDFGYDHAGIREKVKIDDNGRMTFKRVQSDESIGAVLDLVHGDQTERRVAPAAPGDQPEHDAPGQR